MGVVGTYIKEFTGGEVDEIESSSQDADDHKVDDHTQKQQCQLLAVGEVLPLKALVLLQEVGLQ